MPYASFPEDKTSLWFEANFPLAGDIAQLHPGRQNILLLPYVGLDIGSLANQFKDSQLSTHYNLLAIDFRSQGRTVNDAQEPHDCWVCAATILKLLARLRIPEVHVFGNGALSIGTAIRLALLWPTGIKSLALLSVHKFLEDWLVDTFKELTITLATARSLEEIEDIINELIPYLFYDGLPEDELDFFATYLTKQYPPTQISRFNDMLFCFRTQWLEPLTNAQLAHIQQPVLILQPEDVLTCSRESGEDLRKQLPKASPLHFQVLHTPAAACYFTRCSAGRVNQLYNGFLGSLPPRREATITPPDLRTALQALSRLMRRTDLSHRDPQKALSFSCISTGDLADEHAIRAQLRQLEQHAFSPLGPNGELPGKFIERHSRSLFGRHRSMSNGEWVYSAIDVRVGQGEHVSSDSEGGSLHSGTEV